MRKKAAVAVRRVVGSVFVLVGIVGLALPFLQGVFFIVIGFYMLSLDSVWFRGKLDEWSSRDGRVAAAFRRVDETIRHAFGINRP